jgi:hypothetical protein
MTISWNSPPSNGGFPIESYEVYVDNTLHTSVDPSLTSLQLTGLTLGTEYKIEVAAKNKVGEASKNTAVNLLFANVPSAPATLTATSTSEQVTLAWTAPASINGDAVSGYMLYYDYCNGSEYELVYNGTSVSEVYEVTLYEPDVSCGSVCNFGVAALNVAGESDLQEVEKRIGEVSDAPDNLIMTSISVGTSVTLEWTAPEDTGCLPIDYYTIERDGADLAA